MADTPSTLQATSSYTTATDLWVPLTEAYVNLQATAVGTYAGHYSVSLNELSTVASPTGEKHHFLYLNPADYALTGFTLKLRLIMSYSQNATAIGGSAIITGGLYPYIAAGTTTTWTPSVGTVVSGSTASPGAGVPGSAVEGRAVSSTFTAPTADSYQLAVALSGATSAGTTRIHLRLEYTYA